MTVPVPMAALLARSVLKGQLAPVKILASVQLT